MTSCVDGRLYAPAQTQRALPHQPCDLCWLGDALLVATYDYIESERVRRGGLCALGVVDGALVDRGGLELRGGYAVAPHPDGRFAAVATADGRVVVVAVDAAGAAAPRAVASTEARGCLFTSVEWTGGDELVAAEGDGGRVSLWRWDGAAGLSEVRAWAAHAHAPGCPAEVWCATADAPSGLVLSGADDGLLKGWDARAPAPALALRHDAGVTAVLARGGAVFSGSYDERLRRWDLRAATTPADALSLGAGVYGLNADGPDALLAACMAAGARVVRAADGDRLACAGTYAHHGSLVYGAARHAASGRVASCSFYDRGVHVWDDAAPPAVAS